MYCPANSLNLSYPIISTNCLYRGFIVGNLIEIEVKLEYNLLSNRKQGLVRIGQVRFCLQDFIVRNAYITSLYILITDSAGIVGYFSLQ